MGSIDLPIIRGVCAVAASSMTDAPEGMQALGSEVGLNTLQDPFQFWSFLEIRE